MVKRCHRLQLRAPVMGMDPTVLFATAVVFGVASQLLHNPVASLAISASVSVALHLLGQGKLPKYGLTLVDFIRWPAEHPALGSDLVPRFPGANTPKRGG